MFRYNFVHVIDTINKEFNAIIALILRPSVRYSIYCKWIFHIAWTRIDVDVELVLRFENLCRLCVLASQNVSLDSLPLSLSLSLSLYSSSFSYHTGFSSFHSFSSFHFFSDLQHRSDTALLYHRAPGSYIRRLTRDLLRNSLANEIKFLSSHSVRILSECTVYASYWVPCVSCLVVFFLSRLLYIHHSHSPKTAQKCNLK